MSDQLEKSPIAEQEICVTCGLCCDGTLFEHAILQPGETGNLPELIENAYGKDGEKEYFKLPCSYFCGYCTIYNKKKASICSEFRCYLLKNFAKSKITQEEAIKIVSNALVFRSEIYQHYTDLFGDTLSFRAILTKLREFKSFPPENEALNNSLKLLKMKCSIYDSLLTKNFKSKKDFLQMLEPSNE